MIKFEKLPAGIKEKLPQVTELLLRDPRVIFAYVFGGLTNDVVRPLSDVDIALYFDTDQGIAEAKLDLFDKISDILGTAEIDLVILNNAPESLAGRILQNRKILADKDPFRRHAYESLTLRKFFDFRIKEEAFFKARYGIG